ncbi:hypothetical protein Tco_1049436 [Tanacetum coccineum]
MDILPQTIILDSLLQSNPFNIWPVQVCYRKYGGKHIDDLRPLPGTTQFLQRVMCILQDDGSVITSLFVVPSLIRKECYELPPFPLRFNKLMRRESCGLGFDTSTNTWKMLCVLLKEYAPPDISLICYSDIKTEDGGRPVIWFDVEKEEFGLIDPPKRMCDLWGN